MKLADLIDRIEYISDDKGSISIAEIRDILEDDKTLDIYCRFRMTLYNFSLILDDRIIDIDEILTDAPCRIKIKFNEIDTSNGTCSFECDLYKIQIFVEDMISHKNLAYEVEKQIASDVEAGKINVLDSLEIRPVLKSVE